MKSSPLSSHRETKMDSDTRTALIAVLERVLGQPLVRPSDVIDTLLKELRAAPVPTQPKESSR